MASVLDSIKNYQEYIKSNPHDEKRVLRCMEKLFNLPVTVHHLQETGVGRTVNSLRKVQGDVGMAAKALVNKWKLMVAAEESSEPEDDPNHNTSTNNGRDSDSDQRSDVRCKDTSDEYYSDDRHDDRPHDNMANGHRSTAKRYHSSEDEVQTRKRQKSSPEEYYSPPTQIIKRERSCSPEVPQIKTESSHYLQIIKREHSSSVERKVKRESSSSQENSQDSDSETTDSDRRKGHTSRKEEKSKSSRSHHSKSRDRPPIKPREQSRDRSTSKESSKHLKEKSKHEKSSSRDKDSEEHGRSDKEKRSSEHERHKSDKHRSSDKHKSSSSNDKYDRHKDTEKLVESSKEKTKSSSDKHKSKDREEKHKSEKDKSKDKTSSLKESSSHLKESSNHSKESSVHSKDGHSHSKDKSISSKDRSSSSKDRSSSSKDRSSNSNDRNSSSKDKSSSSKEKRNSHKDKVKETSSDKSRSSDKAKAGEAASSKEVKKSSSSQKSSSRDSDKPKKKKVPTNEDDVDNDGIGCESGASFAEALGMISPAKTKKKTTKDLSSPYNSFPSVSKELPVDLLAPTTKLPPLPPLEIASALPEISPNYKPRPPPKLLPFITESDTMSAFSTKNQRTKVYSGNKVVGNIPTLYELCVTVLQEHIDALEYTGGVPYDILKPVVDKATPNQLFMLEHFNAYLMDDTDHLWQKHCEKKFRNKARQELESWREMFLRCQEEQEARLKCLTANIKQSQDARMAPTKQTKMAYVDSVVKPPRNIARKQAIHGTARAAVTSPAARVASLAGSMGVVKAGSLRPPPAPSSSSALAFKPKKAPLMAKALQLMRGRKR